MWSDSLACVLPLISFIRNFLKFSSISFLNIPLAASFAISAIEYFKETLPTYQPTLPSYQPTHLPSYLPTYPTYYLPTYPTILPTYLAMCLCPLRIYFLMRNPRSLCQFLYPVLKFEPTTSSTWVVSHNHKTRALLLFDFIIFLALILAKTIWGYLKAWTCN